MTPRLVCSFVISKHIVDKIDKQLTKQLNWSMVEQTNNPMDEMDGSDDEFFDACEDINQSKHNFSHTLP